MVIDRFSVRCERCGKPPDSVTETRDSLQITCHGALYAAVLLVCGRKLGLMSEPKGPFSVAWRGTES